MIVDSDGSTCITAAFSYGLSSTTSRAYTIKVTQFESTNDMGGPPGCLQFFTGNSGTVSSFNYAAVTTSMCPPSCVTITFIIFVRKIGWDIL